MTEQITELKQRLVVSRKRDGRCCYDPQAKRELIEAGLQPGVSVAKLALAHGINANLLRTWMTKHQRQLLAGDSPQRSAAARSPFIPVAPVSACRSPIMLPELAARLPNGVRLEWSALPPEQLAQVLRLLSSLPCSDSIPG
ncbi:transposase [Dechloromonas denitrificans]|uniref:transposase n=1 Tax=Dechloromonas denitrificans TaxID=281362 RepID=UPI001CF9C382|nr:transposase [Dechloromonas denitrificans]UCV06194.1 transposase [Dechloromonas denitrificans]UCV07199.1 transposase [Dechloromonas denitrificans]UCV08540.1 transposase [Dechloromonas denitrificans]UCV09423.1 transposase [Dechloromonas denitrificans]